MRWLDRITKGMMVKSSTGRELGPVTQHEGDAVIIDGGKDVEYIADYGRIDDVRDGAVWLRARDGDGARTAANTDLGRDEGRDVSMQLLEEELDVRKRMKQAGEVRVHKGVTHETREVTVPVVREEVHVERTAGAGREADAGAAAFREETISMPVMEEEVEVTKRPVVREHVRVRKERHVEQRAASETVRKEHAEVEGTPDSVLRRDRDDDPGTWK